MDRKLFQPEAPGELVDVTAGEAAFIPHPLPPGWQFPERLWPTLVAAQHHLGKLEGKASLLSDPEILLRPLQRREALRSSSLEGTHATPKELLLFELDPQVPAAPSSADSWREVFNYTTALRVEESSQQPMGLHLIRQLHSILMEGVRGQSQSPGTFRTTQVYIGHDKRFVPPPVTHLQDCLSRLEEYLRAVPDRFDPLVRCYLIHYQLETIHPFMDGNGRVGRLLLAVMIKSWCGLTKPWLYMSAFFEKHKDEYIDRLFNVSARGDWTSWIEFCLRGTLAQADDTISRCAALLSLRKKFTEALSGNVRLLKLVDDLFRSPMVRVVDAQQRLKVTYPTAKADIQRLVDAGILEEVETSWPKAFFAPEIFDIAFGDGDPSPGAA